LSREEPDRVPLYDLVSSTALIEHFSGQQLTLENAEHLIPLALSRALDMTRIFLPGLLGRRTDDRGFVYERRDPFNEWQIEVPFHDLPGLAAFVRAEIERLEAWQPADPAADLRELLAWKARFAGTVIPASWAGEALQDAYITVGLEWFTWLEADQPELVRPWVDALHGQTMRRLRAEAGCRAVSPVAWIFADIAYKGRLMFSPGYLHGHGFFRRIAEICGLYHGYGLKVIFHSDGYLLPVIPDLIAAGVDALAPVDVGAGLDLAELKAAFGGQVALVGGIDVEGVLRTGTPDGVRRATLAALAAAGPGGGLILGSSSEELFDTLPLANILTMIETTWERGRYPIGKHFPL
jgi:hypothetical protein